MSRDYSPISKSEKRRQYMKEYMRRYREKLEEPIPEKPQTKRDEKEKELEWHLEDFQKLKKQEEPRTEQEFYEEKLKKQDQAQLFPIHPDIIEQRRAEQQTTQEIIANQERIAQYQRIIEQHMQTRTPTICPICKRSICICTPKPQPQPQQPQSVYEPFQ